MKQERMASNEHEAARRYAEHLIHQDFMEQTYSVIFKAVPATTYCTVVVLHFFPFLVESCNYKKIK